MSRNAELAELLEEFADRLEAADVEYKPRAYRRAAENLFDYPVAIEELAEGGPAAIAEIEGVGEAISEKVIEYLETGSIEELEGLREEMPVRIDELTAVEGVGPKTVGALYEALGITTLDELEAAAEAGEIQEVKGFGAKTEENILSNLPFARRANQRELLGHARPVADDILSHLAEQGPIDRVEVAGSIRRWRATIGDVDVLVGTEEPKQAVEAFREWEAVERVLEAGETKASVRARGVQVDLRVVGPEEFGAAWQYFTGSRDHNVRLRNRAIERDLKMNEYGVFDITDVTEEALDADRRAGSRIAGKEETEMYEALDLPWIPPELREDNGEVDAAASGALPTLVEANELRGDLHTHTEWSDGTLSLEAWVQEAEAFGHEYLGICDHATGPGIVGGMGLEDEEILEQRDRLLELTDDRSIRVFAGIEANIDAKGQLSVSEDVLEELDLVVAAAHSALDQDQEAATERLVTAVSHPSVDILGHPRGRLLNRRPGLNIDIETLAQAAASHETALEVNANPHRLDLDGNRVRLALEEGATIVINTDAHSVGEFGHLRFGVHTARRGWAEAADILNSRSVRELESFFD